jgi:hypothetical protein
MPSKAWLSRHEQVEIKADEQKVDEQKTSEQKVEYREAA